MPHIDSSIRSTYAMSKPVAARLSPPGVLMLRAEAAPEFLPEITTMRRARHVAPLLELVSTSPTLFMRVPESRAVQSPGGKEEAVASRPRSRRLPPHMADLEIGGAIANEGGRGKSPTSCFMRGAAQAHGAWKLPTGHLAVRV